MRARLVPTLAELAFLGKRHYVVLGELRVPRIGVLPGAHGPAWWAKAGAPTVKAVMVANARAVANFLFM